MSSNERQFNSKWVALAREAGIAAEHLAIGVTALGKANYAQHAYYGQAFFALSTGFERAAKLALVVDHALEHDGEFPTNEQVREFGHDLRKLLERVDEIASRRGAEYRLPRTAIHDAIVSVLGDFAKNITRYYNLDLVTGAPNVQARQDPIREWFDKVMTPVLKQHYRPTKRKAARRRADVIAQMMGDHVSVLYTNERGETMSDLADASMQTAIGRAAEPWVRMYIMQIARFVAMLLSDLGYAGGSYDSIPYFADFFRMYNNDERYFRERKAWSIYR